MKNKITYHKVGDYYLPNLTLEKSKKIWYFKNINIKNKEDVYGLSNFRKNCTSCRSNFK